MEKKEETFKFRSTPEQTFNYLDKKNKTVSKTLGSKLFIFAPRELKKATSLPAYQTKAVTAYQRAGVPGGFHSITSITGVVSN